MSKALHLALLGAGQLGGSFALALRAADPAVKITAYDRDLSSARRLQAMGGANAVAETAAQAVATADMVVLATPVRSFDALAQSIAPMVRVGTLITDLGSVKRSMLAVAQALPQALVVPAHPITGSEKSGVAEARADLFTGKLCVLTPETCQDTAAIEAIEALWQSIGADVIAMPIALHDQVYALMSHLPHLIAFAASEYFHTNGIKIPRDDAMLQRFFRIARSNARMWTDIFLDNREALLPALATLVAILGQFERELRRGDAAKAVAPSPRAFMHVPRILASSLIATVTMSEEQLAMNLKPFSGGGMRDVVAPAAEAPEAAMEEISGMADEMAAAVAGMVQQLTRIAQWIGAEDEPALFNALQRMAAHAEEI